MTKIYFYYLFFYYLSCLVFLEPVFFTVVGKKNFFLHLWSNNQLSCRILWKILTMRPGDYQWIINYDWPYYRFRMYIYIYIYIIYIIVGFPSADFYLDATLTHFDSWFDLSQKQLLSTWESRFLHVTYNYIFLPFFCQIQGFWLNCSEEIDFEIQFFVKFFS